MHPEIARYATTTKPAGPGRGGPPMTRHAALTEAPARGRNGHAFAPGSFTGRVATCAPAIAAWLLIAAPAMAQPKPPETRLLQVIMIEATMSDLPAEGIPRAAMQSLADMRDILPYKGYRLLDTALLRTASHANATLKGPGGRPFSVHLSMDQPRARAEEEEGPDLFFRSFRVAEAGTESPPEPEGTDTKESYAPRAPKAPRTLISTSFGMDVGETLIVGSSRLDGDQTALILLVTALP